MLTIGFWLNTKQKHTKIQLWCPARGSNECKGDRRRPCQRKIPTRLRKRHMPALRESLSEILILTQTRIFFISPPPLFLILQHNGSYCGVAFAFWGIPCSQILLSHISTLPSESAAPRKKSLFLEAPLSRKRVPTNKMARTARNANPRQKEHAKALKTPRALPRPPFVKIFASEFHLEWCVTKIRDKKAKRDAKIMRIAICKTLKIHRSESFNRFSPPTRAARKNPQPF